MKNILNYIQINEQISTAGQPTKEQFKSIAKEGFDVVINLAMHNKGALKKNDGLFYFIFYHCKTVQKGDSYAYAMATIKQ